jgi:probable addiction module antidote protein
MTRKTRPYREALLEALSDPVEAAHYLSVALEDSPEMFRKACLNVIQARQVAKVAREAGVTRESLYRSFSESGNPSHATIELVLDALDLKFSGIAAKEAGSGSSFPPESGRPRGVRRRHRSRGVSGSSQHQLSLPFSASPLTIGIAPTNAGPQINIAQLQDHGVGMVGVGIVAEAIPQSSILPGFISYAMQRESYTAANLYGEGQP